MGCHRSRPGRIPSTTRPPSGLESSARGCSSAERSSAWAAILPRTSPASPPWRASVTILDRPRVLLPPRPPYHPHPAEPYRASVTGTFWELPISTGALGFPLTGTFIATWPSGLLAHLRRAADHRPLWNLELHGVDL